MLYHKQRKPVSETSPILQGQYQIKYEARDKRKMREKVGGESQELFILNILHVTFLSAPHSPLIFSAKEL